jgi:hypothetical protein
MSVIGLYSENDLEIDAVLKAKNGRRIVPITDQPSNAVQQH